MTQTTILPKTLHTERLILKAVTEVDIPAYERHFVDYEVIRHLSADVPWPYPADGVSSFIKNVILPNQGKGKWVWGIFRKEQPDELIGAVDLYRDGKPENRGFWLGKQFWGQGIMTEAVAPIMDFAFNELGFEKLVFSNAVGNIKSRRIKEKTGAEFVGIKEAAFVDPAYTQHEIWELNKHDWFTSQKASGVHAQTHA